MVGEKVNLDEIERLISEYLETLPDNGEWFEAYTSYRSIASDVLEEWNGEHPSFIEWLKSKTAS